MARVRGANLLHDVQFETTYGTKPIGNWLRRRIVSTALGAEQGLIEDDTLGGGRETADPSRDVVNNTGDHVVPVDVRGFGVWLKLAFGGPTTTGNVDDGYTHVFNSGGVLPSASIQIGHPEIPRYFVHTGVKLNTLRVALARSGMLNATLGLVAQSEADFATSQSGTPGEIVMERFAQAIGEVKKDGVTLANVVAAEFSFSNNLDVVETIRPDGLIDGADEAMATSSGNITLRFADMTMLTAATSGEPVALSFGWAFGEYSLLFALPRVFLPRAKRPVTGPGGVQVRIDWQGSGADGHVVTATLINDVATY